MKLIYFFISITLIACQGKVDTTQNSQHTETISLNETTHQYDSLLALQYGADQYGMKAYVVAFLKTGPNSPTDSTHAVELQKAHLNNISRLAEEGKLVVAGPFYGEAKGDFRGIYIFNTNSIDSARAYTESDPAIQFGSLKMELINWYGSAAMMSINELHHKIAKENP